MKTIECDYSLGCDLGEVYASLVKMAIKDREHYSTVFNLTEINTTMSLDEVFSKVCDKTYTEFIAAEDEKRAEYKRKEEEWESSYKIHASLFVKDAKPYINESLWAELERVAPIRFSDIYHGSEMWAFLDIVKEWRNSQSKEKCGKMFYDQGHSGFSAGIVSSLVATFCDKELAEYIYNYQE